MFLDHIMNRKVEILCLFKFIGSFLECLCNDGVQDYVGRGNRIGGTDHTELKLVSCECERGCTVSVCRIFIEIRKCRNTGL